MPFQIFLHWTHPNQDNLTQAGYLRTKALRFNLLFLLQTLFIVNISAQQPNRVEQELIAEVNRIKK